MLKSFVICFFLLCSILVSGQTKNLRNFDRGKVMHFGAYFAMNKMSFDLNYIPEFYTLDSLYGFEVGAQPGFNLGIVADLHMGDQLDLRALPSLVFASREMKYTVQYKNDPVQSFSRTVESTFGEIPILLKYKTVRNRNMRAYLLGGVRASYDFASQKHVDPNDKEVVRLRRVDYGYEFGFGMDFYLEYFKLAPEIRYYRGVRDMLIKDGTVFTTSVESAFSRGIVFSITFEG